MDHIPVLLKEMITFLDPKEGDVIVDTTFGAGGYSKMILSKSKASVIAIDRDPTVKKYVDELRKEYGERISFVCERFSNLSQILESLSISKIDAIVTDLGVSSMQLDNRERGFSFNLDSKLDMRMGEDGYSAYEIINQYEETELADIIYQYGDEHRSRAIAKKIVTVRKEKPIHTTCELADIIRKVVGYKKQNYKIDPATKTFQAIRIYINQELIELKKLLPQALKSLRIGGIMMFISFHALEDRIIKKYFFDQSGKSKEYNDIDKYVPIDLEKKDKYPLQLINTKVIKPKEEEIKDNPRSRSSKMRVARRVL